MSTKSTAQALSANESREAATVGSGYDFAFVALIERGYKSDLSLPDAVLRVYYAKKAAELASGVGESTRFLVLQVSAEPKWIDEAQLKTLDPIVDRLKQVSLTGEEEAIVRTVAGR